MGALLLRRGLRSARSSTGLFGIEGLFEPRDLLTRAEDAIRKCAAIKQEISATPPSVRVIQQLDDISDTVCQVYDAAEFCRNVHAEPVWRHEANATCEVLGGFIHELNNDKSLYDSLVQSLLHHDRLQSQRKASTSQAANSSEPLEGYTREALLVGKLLRRDFETAGIHLDGAKQHRITELNTSIRHVGFQILSNMADDSVSGSTGPRSAYEMLRDVDGSVREEGFRGLLSTPAGNLPLLEALAEQRRELASLLGAESYAEYTLDGATLAGAPEAVAIFLEDLNRALEPELKEELQQLQRVKMMCSESRSKSAQLQPWDREFCKSIRKAMLAGQLEAARSHFHVLSLLGGLEEILARVFGVSMAQLPLAPGETWADNIVKLSLEHETDGPLGIIYLDLFRRSYKFAGSAHFTLRCKKRLTGGGVQLPVVALAFNFSSPFLEPCEVETLFHEFGHALHSLLSRTELQHLAGTRGPLDMIEIPSHFFEYFIREPSCLQLCTRHHESGAALPRQAIDLFRSFCNDLPNLKMNDTIVNAMIDQQFHGSQSDAGRLSGSIAEVVGKYSAFHPSPDPGLHWHVRLGHLVNYGASYYSYVYAQFIAGAVWRQHFADDPLSREAGEHARSRLLDLGGSKEPKLLIDNLLGQGSLQRIGRGWAPSADLIASGNVL